MKVANSLLYRIPLYEQTIATSYRLSVIIPVYNERHVVETSLRRVLALEHELISSLELIVVDDSSTDGTLEVLKRLADEDARITLIAHETNRGKGAAIRTALSHSTGDIVVIHDADLEYNPADIPSLLVPFAKEGADAVFGSRYLSAPYRRALMYRHTMINKVLTILGNWFTDLTLTDIETCYKMFTREVLQSLNITANDFGIEVQISAQIASARKWRIYETAIHYYGRTYHEGKKINWKDGLKALWYLFKYRMNPGGVSV